MNQTKSIKTNKTIESVLTEILERYAIFPKEEGVDAFMLQILSESPAQNTAEGIDGIVQEISGTIDGIREGYQDIQNYKSRGLSAAIWLRDAMDRATSDFNRKDKSSIISSVKQALASGNSEIISSLTQSEVQGPIIPELICTEFTGIDRTGIAQNLSQEIQLNSGLNIISTDGILTSPYFPSQEIQIVKEYFENQIDAHSDDDFKKVVSTGIELAKEYDLLPDAVADYTPAELTAIVDRGVSTAKVAYKVAQGEIDVTTATDYLIDRATSTVGVMIRQGCKKIGGIAGGAVGGFVGAIVGKFTGGKAAELGARIGQEIGKVAGAVVGEILVEGSKKIASAAKYAVRACVNGAKRAVEAVGGSISRAWDWCTSWF